MKKPIYVTTPSLAPLSDYLPYLEQIWETGIMTHNGPFVQKLEQKLAEYLGVKHIVCVANGTCALQLAIRSLNLSGEIITTPFSFIATANIISWERCRPVFVDIDPDTWNLDPYQIEERITSETTAILPVHVFSAPCDVDRIQDVANRHGLRVIYDAAHAMAVRVDGQSVLNYGDISALSFHATKIFNTAEGGACVTSDDIVADRLRRMRFFGFDGEKRTVDDGMNAKMTELSAGLGLANLDILDLVLRDRQEKYDVYVALLANSSGITIQKFDPESYNFSYFPLLLKSSAYVERIEKHLASHEIYPRRYFYPSLNKVTQFSTRLSLPVAEDISQRILCLPLFFGLTIPAIHEICGHIQDVLTN